MAKIILMRGDDVLQEVGLTKERMTIGRRPHNDLVLNDPVVSGDHAVIVTLFKDSFLEDLNATNGTLVNRLRIKKHFLQNGDLIEIGAFRMRFLDEARAFTNIEQRAPSSSMALEGRQPPVFPIQTSGSQVKAPATAAVQACIRVISGANAGKELVLSKPLTTIGKSGKGVAVIALNGSSYYLSHVEGEARPRVNGVDTGLGAYSLSHGDVVEVGSNHLKFVNGPKSEAVN